jgi:hypothetical protein
VDHDPPASQRHRHLHPDHPARVPRAVRHRLHPHVGRPG